MKKYVVVLFAAGFIACNSSSTTTQTVDTSSSIHADTTIGANIDTTTKATIQVPNMRCFKSNKGKNTVYLKVEKNPDVITGSLEYNFYEKDSNKGTIDGVMKGDTLIADYTFMSEGKQSVRQVVFLIKDTTATEGYGDMKERNGKMVFKNTAALKFGSWVLKEIPCPVE